MAVKLGMNSASKRYGCREFRKLRISRRAALSLGSLGAGAAAFNLAQLLKAELQAPPNGRKAAAKSVILLYQFGGPSHIDSFDPKPNAPKEIRGEFQTISTAIPDVRFTEHVPRLAGMADRFALVRSVQHTSSNHNAGAFHSLVGRKPLVDRVTLNASATDFPHPGSTVSSLVEPRSDVPLSVSLPHMIADGPFRTPGQFAGFLGKMYDPLWILRDPNDPGFRVDELSLPASVDVARIDDRKTILDSLARVSDLSGKHSAVAGMETYQQRALDLLTSRATRAALTIDRESPATRERYGRHTYGQSVLLARRLVEAGVRFVTVYYSKGIHGWDTHEDNFAELKNKLLPHTDQTVSALIDDLDGRGLLSETLVYWTGDFGRTPRVNQKAGRDHWPPCQTVLMAGGGIAGGGVYGASDGQGSYPHERPCGPDDVTATLFHALGLDPETVIHDQLHRPMPISTGRPLVSLFG